jgi:5-formyltetrahydrofolate cyclo-ligase
VSDLKRAIRLELRERRRNRTSKQTATDTKSLTTHLTQLVESCGARSISVYLSLPTEPDVRPFIEWAIANDIRVLLPVSRDDGLLDWIAATPDFEEELGLHGVPEPAGEVLGPVAINDVDLILVPAASVDAQGTRLGWGRGYFDRTLGSMVGRPPVFAVVFDDEFVDELPSEVHDSPVDGVVTPAAVTRFVPGREHRH